MKNTGSSIVQSHPTGMKGSRSCSDELAVEEFFMKKGRKLHLEAVAQHTRNISRLMS